MKNKQYEFKIIDSYNYAWRMGEGRIAKDYNSLDEALSASGKNGWYIVAVNFVERKDKKQYMVFTMQRDLDSGKIK